MAKIIAIANQKGGVGKTTTTVNLSACLADKGQRVLLADCDPQGNSTSGFGIVKDTLEKTIYHLLIGEAAVEEIIIKTEYGVDVLPARIELAGAEIELVSAMSRELRLRKALLSIADEYDYVIIDCPPSLGLLTINALTAAESLLIPLQCEFYALEGLTQLMQTISLVQQNLNEALHIEGVLLTMYDSRTKLASQVVSEVREHFAELVYKTMIPRTVRLSEAPSYGQPIIVYDNSSKGAEAYMSLAGEVLSNG